LIDQDEDEFGMTLERQAMLRSKIYTMLGDRGKVSAATAATSASIASSGATGTRAAVADATANVPILHVRPPAAALSRGNASNADLEVEGLSIDAIQLSDSTSSGPPSGRAVVGAEPGAGAAGAESETEWTCERCTLINSGIFVKCFACDAPRP
jgi:Zn-finger in Ran binding protein and others